MAESESLIGKTYTALDVAGMIITGVENSSTPVRDVRRLQNLMQDREMTFAQLSEAGLPGRAELQQNLRIAVERKIGLFDVKKCDALERGEYRRAHDVATEIGRTNIIQRT